MLILLVAIMDLYQIMILVKPRCNRHCLMVKNYVVHLWCRLLKTYHKVNLPIKGLDLRMLNNLSNKWTLS